LPDRENAEVPQLDAVAARHRRDNLVDYSVDDLFHVALIEMRVPIGNTLDKLRFEHRRPHATVMRLAKGRNPVKAKASAQKLSDGPNFCYQTIRSNSIFRLIRSRYWPHQFQRYRSRQHRHPHRHLRRLPHPPAPMAAELRAIADIKTKGKSLD
jgi:hypothetical protein